MALQYFYDGQLRRYLLQFVRIFNGFQYEAGKDSSGNPIFRTVPATYASMDRQVNAIQQNNSENILQSTPQMSCSINSLRRSPERIQDPNYVRVKNVYERQFNQTLNKYEENTAGKVYTVESYMPVPYDLIVHMDLWTSNEFQKQQLMEQLLVLFNPSIDLQTSNNVLDWSALTIVTLDEITWSSRSYPAGTTDQIDVATLSFKMPIWLNAPSKIKRQNIIQQIVIDIGLIEDLKPVNGDGYYFSESDLVSRLIVTPGDHHITVMGNEIILLNGDGGTTATDGSPLSWVELMARYGKFRRNISQIKLKPPGTDFEDNSKDITGTIELNPNDPSKLYWTLDLSTMKPDTLQPITQIVDPLQKYPGNGLDFPAIGQRYLILNDIPEGIAWGGLSAFNNVMPKDQDIIEYTANGWIITFDASNNNQQQYVSNMSSGRQLAFTDSIWYLSIEGEYFQGFWHLYL